MPSDAHIYIIESTSEQDLQDGRDEGPTLRAALGHAGREAELITVRDKEEFFSALGAVMAHASAGQIRTPIVHISMHGASSGVGLTSGELVGWDLLGGGLGILRDVLGDRVMVAMSTCEGLAGIRMAHSEGDPPFLSLVGPKRNVAWRDTIAAFVAFYHVLFRTRGQVDQAVRVMNDVIGEALFEFRTGYGARAEYVAAAKRIGDGGALLAGIRRLSETTTSAGTRARMNSLYDAVIAGPRP